jgi:hypothetical protein
LPVECDGSEPPKWHASASAGGFDTVLDFDGTRVHLGEVTGFATLSLQRSPRVSWQLTLGGIFDGTATTEGVSDGDGDVAGGGAVSVGWSYLALYEEDRRPFLQVAASAGVSVVSARADDGERHLMTSGDLRVGVLVGKTFWARLTTYAAARGFFGPVFWHVDGEARMGGDVHHYALGLGAILRLPGNVDLFVEGMGLGEQSASLGAGVSF